MMLRRTPLALSTFLLLAVGCATAESTSPAPSGGDEGKPGSLVPDGAETEDFDGVEPVDISVPAPDTGEESSSEATLAGTPAAQALVLYVNRAGRTYLGANRDDPAKGTSFIVARYGSDRIDFPAANYSEAEWAEIMGIVRGYFVPYAIDVTDTRPASGVYTEIAVGDTYSSVLGAGLGRNTVGIAPVGPCRPAKNSVGFVFTKLYDGRRGRDLRGVAETIAHEAGHTLSLSHMALASDLMSYSPTSAGKKFQDAVAACGPNASTPQACSCPGKTTQNSHGQLLAAVGPRGAAPPAPPPAPPPGPGADRAAPVVSFVAPAEGATLPANSTIEVSAEAQDDVGVTSLDLFWQFAGRILPCDGSVAGVTCQKDGNRTTWRINVGTGERTFYAVARDAAGNEGRSPVRTVRLVSGNTPAPVDAKPVLEPRLPAAGATLQAGATVVFEVRATDDKGLDSVVAQWRSATSSVDVPLRPTADPAVFRAEVGLRAGVTGGREVVFTATDDAGQVTTSAPVPVRVQ